MLNGLYKVEFQTPLGMGAGVVVIENGTIRGGDSMMSYVGTYTEHGKDFTAKVEGNMHSRVPWLTSVFGMDRTHINLTGKINGNASAIVQGRADEAPNVPFQARLTKIH
jgi:T3SS negative regulator,GrlR